MANTAPRKFSFNDFCDFEQDAARRAEAATAETAQTSFSELEVAEARTRGYAEGHADALAEMQATTDQRNTDANEQIAAGIAHLMATEPARMALFQKMAFEVAIAAVRKVMPDLTRKFGQHEIESAIGEILREQMEEPRIVVRVADATFDALSGHIDNLAKRQGYSGKLILLADGTMSPTDLQVEWADGGAERSVERTLADITGAIARLTNAQTVTTSTSTD